MYADVAECHQGFGLISKDDVDVVLKFQTKRTPFGFFGIFHPWCVEITVWDARWTLIVGGGDSIQLIVL